MFSDPGEAAILGAIAGQVSNLKSEIDEVKEIVMASDMTPLFIRNLVRQGKAQEYFQIGDQIDVPWVKGATEYILPFDVVSFEPVFCEGDTEARPAMWLQSHYAVEGVQYDQCEAFYVAPEGGLEAGTYNVTFVEKWGQIAANTTMEFTLTADVPAGGMLVFNTGLPDKTSASDVKLFVYANATTQTASETCLLTEGSSGTSLGSVSTATKYGASGLNNYQRAVYGYNRWSQSALRQYLNSDQPKNMWWTPKNEFDRAPAQLSTLDGFLAGFSADFRSALGKVKVSTALNTTSDSEIGTTEDTYDYMFASSLEQEYIVPQLAGAEGNYWPYWKERLGLDSPQAQGSGGAMAEHIRYAYENHSSAQYVRLRSANRGGAHGAWTVSATGYAYGYDGATTANRPAPACVIC